MLRSFGARIEWSRAFYAGREVLMRCASFFIGFLAAFLLISAAGAQTVLITGSNRGIGLEFAKQYADKGWTVIATHRRAAGMPTVTWGSRKMGS